jgi:hypothetical protein
MARRSRQEDTMNRIPKLFALTATAVATSLLVTACGGGDATPPSAASVINAGTTASAPDTRVPSVSIFDDTPAATATGPVTFTFVFNKDVGASFTASDVVVTGGTAGTLTKVSGTQATMVVTPTPNTAGTLNVSVAVGTFSDLVGNSNTASATAQHAYSSVVLTQMALPVSFDSVSVGYGLVGFGGAEDSTLVADPTNAANKVAKVVRAAGSETYAGTTVTATNSAGVQTGFSPKIPFNTTDKSMTVRVWSPDAGIPVRLKVEDSTDGNKSVETEATVTTAGGWQTLTFDFANQATGTAALNLGFNYNKATIFFDFNRAKASSVQKTYYFDDVAFVTGGACGTTVPTCAPSTTIPAGSNVIYSDATTITGLNKKPDWGQNPAVVFSEPSIAGNASLQYTFSGNALYEGIDWAGTPQNVSTKATLHLDVWSADVGSLNVFLIGNGENGITKTLTAGGWNALDIDLAQYTAPDKTQVIQIKLVPSTAGTIYVDNIYFYGTASGGTSSGTGFAGGVFADDYVGSLPATSKSVQGGDVGFFYDARLFNTKVYDYGGVSGTAQDPAGVHNFYYGIGLSTPALTDAYFGAFVKSPGNATVDVSAFANLKLNVWGPDQQFGQLRGTSGTYPALKAVLQGPAVAGCTTNSGGSEISVTFNTTQQGAASIYTLPLSSFTLVGGCGGDTTVAQVLSHIAQINVLMSGTAIQYTTPDSGTPPGYPNGLNIGSIKFSN